MKSRTGRGAGKAIAELSRLKSGKRTEVIHIRLSPGELEAAQKGADQIGVSSPAIFIRKLLIDWIRR